MSVIITRVSKKPDGSQTRQVETHPGGDARMLLEKRLRQYPKFNLVECWAEDADGQRHTFEVIERP